MTWFPFYESDLRLAYLLQTEHLTSSMMGAESVVVSEPWVQNCLWSVSEATGAWKISLIDQSGMEITWYWSLSPLLARNFPLGFPHIREYGASKLAVWFGLWDPGFPWMLLLMMDWIQKRIPTHDGRRWLWVGDLGNTCIASLKPKMMEVYQYWEHMDVLPHTSYICNSETSGIHGCLLSITLGKQYLIEPSRPDHYWPFHNKLFSQVADSRNTARCILATCLSLTLIILWIQCSIILFEMGGNLCENFNFEGWNRSLSVRYPIYNWCIKTALQSEI